MLRPEEVEQLVCGCPTLDLNELRKVTVYDGGFKKDEQTIIDFWQVSWFSYIYSCVDASMFCNIRHIDKVSKFSTFLILGIRRL